MCDKAAHPVLRFGLAFLLAWQGLGLLFFKLPLPSYFGQIFSTAPFVRSLYPTIIGWILVVLALWLALGLFTRIAAVLAGAYFGYNVALILWSVGFQSAVVDITFFLASCSLICSGCKEWSLDGVLAKKARKKVIRQELSQKPAKKAKAKAKTTSAKAAKKSTTKTKQPTKKKQAKAKKKKR